MKLKYIGRILFALSLFIMAFVINGCRKLVSVDPPVTSLTATSVYNSDVTATAVMTGLYTTLSSGSTSGIGTMNSISLCAGLSADEFSLFSSAINSNLNFYYKNALSVSSTGFEYWQTFYPFIFTCNSAIEGLTSATSLTPIVKQQLLGEAKFMRAFFYFYLTNLYGDVPMPLSTDYKRSSTMPRSPKVQVYQQIISDLKDAQNLLSKSYLDATLLKASAERVRPTSWAATALLARVYLYLKDWTNADMQASAVIGNASTFRLGKLNDVFLKAGSGNSEAIWQLQPVNATWNTEDAKAFIIPSTGPGTGVSAPLYLSKYLMSSFETGDQRRLNWVDSVIISSNVYFYSYKYKINKQNTAVTEFTMVLRLGEQYLIRAEARTQEGNISGAQADVDSIRSRAGLSGTLATTQSQLSTVILHERQVELFSELGQRWFDLKRTGSIDTVMGVPNNICANKGGTWNSNWQLYPIYLIDIQRNPSLTQNPGYSQ